LAKLADKSASNTPTITRLTLFNFYSKIWNVTHLFLFNNLYKRKRYEMKTLIIYSSETGNTKMVCEKAFEYINGEKAIIPVKEKDSVNLDDFDNIIVGTWIDKANANAEAKKFINTLSNKKIFFIGTLAASLKSEHAKKCFNNLTKLCSKKNNFVDGVLARGRVSEDLQEKFTKFPLNIIHKFVPNMKEIIIEADSHPDESDFLLIKDFIDKNFNN